MATTTTEPSGTGETDTRLKRGITPLLLFFFIVGDTLGAGIYTLVGSMAKDVGGRSGSRSRSPSCSRC